MDSLIDALEKNQCRGVVYHYPNLLMGDYDSLSSQQEILHLLLNGPQDRIKGGIFMQSFIPWLDRIMAGPLPEEIIACKRAIWYGEKRCCQYNTRISTTGAIVKILQIVQSDNAFCT